VSGRAVDVDNHHDEEASDLRYIQWIKLKVSIVPFDSDYEIPSYLLVQKFFLLISED